MPYSSSLTDSDRSAGGIKPGGVRRLSIENEALRRELAAAQSHLTNAQATVQRLTEELNQALLSNATSQTEIAALRSQLATPQQALDQSYSPEDYQRLAERIHQLEMERDKLRQQLQELREPLPEESAVGDELPILKALEESAPQPLIEAEGVSHTPLLSGIQVCEELGIKDYQLSKLSDEEVRSRGFERVKRGKKSKYRREVNHSK